MTHYILLTDGTTQWVGKLLPTTTEYHYEYECATKGPFHTVGEYYTNLRMESYSFSLSYKVIGTVITDKSPCTILTDYPELLI